MKTRQLLPIISLLCIRRHEGSKTADALTLLRYLPARGYFTAFTSAAFETRRAQDIRLYRQYQHYKFTNEVVAPAVSFDVTPYHTNYIT